MLSENYYKFGGSLEYQHPTYIVRKADFELYEGLKNGEFCYVLNPRQTGKSSLRVHIIHKLTEQGIKCASIDMTRIGSHVTQNEWYGGIVYELLKSLHLLKKINWTHWWQGQELLSPVQRLTALIEDVVLAKISQHIVIFIDEIDSILEIDFKDDFFAFIRACYNQRVDNPDYNRLTFCVLGVATPSDLIADTNRTPFNLGRAIELSSFQLNEIKPLALGLVGKVSNPLILMAEILEWTGGQPFLTQKLCHLIVNSVEQIPKGRETEWIDVFIDKQLIKNWESQDEPEHLKTIRGFLLKDKHNSDYLLRLYQKIIQGEQVTAKENSEQINLCLSGLVVKQDGKLTVANRIYGFIFNLQWVEQELANLRPYDLALKAWLASQGKDELRLLRGQTLQEALVWSADKNLSLEDYQFLNASQALERRESQKTIVLKKQTKETSGELLLAVKRREFQVQYQPIILLATSKIVGFEALARWQHPEQGWISPAKFIPLAEHIGVIVPIGKWILQEACRQLKVWQTIFPEQSTLTISVNLSGQQFWQTNVLQEINQVIHSSNLNAASLKLEIKEIVMTIDLVTAIKKIKQIKTLGVQIEIDNFGTGYSSFDYLQYCPIDTLKIDRSLTSKLSPNNSNSAGIIRDILHKAQQLGINAIAEGVETVEQMIQLQALGCEYGQGFLFSQPVSSKAAEKLLAKSSPTT